MTSKAAKLWPVGSGLCFIAHSLEQHDQAATKGAFVIRPKKGMGLFWVMGDGKWAFILHWPKIAILEFSPKLCGFQ